MIFITYWKEILIATLIAALAFSHTITLREERLNTTLTSQLAVSQSSVATLSTSIDVQNTAIDALKKQAATLALANAARLDIARKSSNANTARANAMLTQSVPVGKTDCEAANDLFGELVK